MARSAGSFLSLLLVWLCALGAGPTSHPAANPIAARGAAEVALRDVADAPVLVSRALVVRSASPRSVERDSASPVSWFIATRRAAAPRTQRATRTTLDRQAVAHARRLRWRVYDAAAPPALSRLAR